MPSGSLAHGCSGPEQNVEVIRLLFAAFCRGEFAALDFLDPEVELQDYPGLAGAGWHHGHDGAIDWAVNLWRAFGHLGVEPVEYIEVDDSRVVVAYEAVGSGKRSGIEVHLTGYALFTMREGKVLHASAHETKQEALEAVQGASHVGRGALSPSGHTIGSQPQPTNADQLSGAGDAPAAAGASHFPPP